MTHLREAIDTYHGLLTDPIAADSNFQLEDQHRRRNLYFGTRPLSSVLRPRFLTTAQYHYLQRSLRQILPAFNKAEAAALERPDVLEQFMLSDWEKELIPFNPGFSSSPNARMDCFFVTDDVEAGTLMMTEYNAETPAAVAYSDVLSDMFYALPAMRQFERAYEVRPLPGRHHMLHALNSAYAKSGVGTPGERMRIAIADWKEVPTYSEFVLFRDYFREMGYECVIADPREMEYVDGKLIVLDEQGQPFHATMVYKRVLLTELVTRSPEGLRHPIIRAVNDRKACLSNPYRCKILHQKASLAVLSDERNEGLFSAAEVRAIRTFIPWTRELSERHTLYEGARIDLVTFARDNKDMLVLKPNDEYGGKGIVLGWTVDQAEWERKIAEYLKEKAIVQRKVVIPSEPYPSYVDGRAQVIDRMLDTDPYIWDSEYASGCLTRLSTAALLNVTAGGGSTVPTFVIEKR